VVAEKKMPSSGVTRVGVQEFRGNFSGYMRQVRHGSSFIVTSRDEVVAIIQPPKSPARRLPARESPDVARFRRAATGSARRHGE
jgi:prevent-host-death family protein